MGDIKHLRKKYKGPSHPWNRQAIDEERKLVQEYGLHRKKEIYKVNSFLKKYKDIAKRLIADRTEQGAKEKILVIRKLQRLGLLSEQAKLDDVLSLELKNVLERRIQSQLYRKGFARSILQARQFISHGHVKIGDAAITTPSYLVSTVEEEKIGFTAKSSLAQADHPERSQAMSAIHEEAEAIRKKPEPQVEDTP